MKTPNSMLLCLLVLILLGSFSVAGRSVAPNPHPQQEATISILFDGLQAVAMGNPERVSVGILDAHHHTPQIKIEKIANNSRSLVALLKGEALHRTLYFDVASGAQGITKFNAPGHENDFGWNLDMESDLYQQKLYLKDNAFVGKLHLSAGLWYATNLTDQRVQFVTEYGKMAAFNRKLGTPAAKINLVEGDALVIRGGVEPIRLVAEQGVRYEMEITNLPPVELADIQHFAHYYDVIGAKVTAYEPVVVKKAAFRPVPLICESVVFSRSTLN